MVASTFCTRLHRRCMAPIRSLPFRTSDNVDHPLNLYGATKKANELMAHAYAHLFAIPATGLRFFTVYGPWGRPDMAMWLFTAAIMQGSPVRLFNHGQMRRDFTHVDDITEAVVRLVMRPAQAQSGMVWRQARSCDQSGAVACLQHRQQSAGGAVGGRCADRAGRRPAGDSRIAADAARRRAGDQCGLLRSGKRYRLSAEHSPRGRDPAVCPLVS